MTSSSSTCRPVTAAALQHLLSGGRQPLGPGQQQVGQAGSAGLAVALAVTLAGRAGRPERAASASSSSA